MNTTKKHIMTIIFTLFIVNYCQSQDKILFKVKEKLDSLYPRATVLVVYKDKSSYLSDTAQEVGIICHCDEALGEIILAFDTNGNVLNKDVFFNSIKDLPDTIINYMKTTSQKFYTNNMIKSINNKGEIGYGIMMPGAFGDDYILWFKNSGELISKKKIPGMRQ